MKTVSGPALELVRPASPTRRSGVTHLVSELLQGMQRLSLQCVSGSTSSSSLFVRNSGSTVLYYNWRVRTPPTLAELKPSAAAASASASALTVAAAAAPAAGDSKRSGAASTAAAAAPAAAAGLPGSAASDPPSAPFTCSLSSGCLLPGTTFEFVFTFAPQRAGVYLQHLLFETTPALPASSPALADSVSGLPLVVLKGTAVEHDDNAVKRDQLLQELERCAAIDFDQTFR